MPAAAGSKLAFDAASVRVSSQRFGLKGGDFLDPVSEMQPPKGGLFSWNVPLVFLINFAYDLRSSQLKRDAWLALPAAVRQQSYTVEARADGTPTRADIRQMVRTLLEERFQFAGHVEKRQGQEFELQVVKPAAGLKVHAEGTDCTLPASVTDVNKYPHAYPPYQSFPPHCGVFNRELSRSGERRLEMLNVTMGQIADSLSSGQQLSVVDETKLTGRYDATLDFGAPGIPQNSETSDELGLPPMAGALEKQLGLKLVKKDAQVDVFVMDHIGTLTEN